MFTKRGAAVVGGKNPTNGHCPPPKANGHSTPKAKSPPTATTNNMTSPVASSSCSAQLTPSLGGSSSCSNNKTHRIRHLSSGNKLIDSGLRFLHLGSSIGSQPSRACIVPSLHAKVGPNQKLVHVHTLEKDNIVIVVKRKCQVWDIFHCVMEHLSIEDDRYFGLAVRQPSEGIGSDRPRHEYFFLDLEQKLSKYLPKHHHQERERKLNTPNNTNPVILLFMRVRVYIRQVEMITCDVALKNYYLQLRENLIDQWSGSQSVREERCWEMAALALQVDQGGGGAEGEESFFRAERYFPLWVIHLRGLEYVRQNMPKVMANKGLTHQEAMVQFCHEASRQPFALNCHLYGLRRHKGDIMDNALIGVTDHGIDMWDIGENGERIPLRNLPWHKMARLSFDNKKVSIGGMDGSLMSLFAQNEAKARYLLLFCREIHQQLIQINVHFGINRHPNSPTLLPPGWGIERFIGGGGGEEVREAVPAPAHLFSPKNTNKPIGGLRPPQPVATVQVEKPLETIEEGPPLAVTAQPTPQRKFQKGKPQRRHQPTKGVSVDEGQQVELEEVLNSAPSPPKAQVPVQAKTAYVAPPPAYNSALKPRPTAPTAPVQLRQPPQYSEALNQLDMLKRQQQQQLWNGHGPSSNGGGSIPIASNNGWPIPTPVTTAPGSVLTTSTNCCCQPPPPPQQPQQCWSVSPYTNGGVEPAILAGMDRVQQRIQQFQQQQQHLPPSISMNTAAYEQQQRQVYKAQLDELRAIYQLPPPGGRERQPQVQAQANVRPRRDFASRSPSNRSPHSVVNINRVKSMPSTSYEPGSVMRMRPPPEYLKRTDVLPSAVDEPPSQGVEMGGTGKSEDFENFPLMSALWSEQKMAMKQQQQQQKVVLVSPPPYNQQQHQ